MYLITDRGRCLVGSAHELYYFHQEHNDDHTRRSNRDVLFSTSLKPGSEPVLSNVHIRVLYVPLRRQSRKAYMNESGILSVLVLEVSNGVFRFVHYGSFCCYAHCQGNPNIDRTGSTVRDLRAAPRMICERSRTTSFLCAIPTTTLPRTTHFACADVIA